MENLDIEILLWDKDDNNVEVEIRNKHTNIVKISKNGEIQKKDDCFDDGPKNDLYEGLTLRSIFDYARNVDISEVREMLDRQIENNTAISDEGLTGRSGVFHRQPSSLRRHFHKEQSKGKSSRRIRCKDERLFHARCHKRRIRQSRYHLQPACHRICQRKKG